MSTRPPFTDRDLRQYGTFGALLSQYALHCREGEVRLRDQDGEHDLHMLLRSSTRSELAAAIVGSHWSSNQPAKFSIGEAGSPAGQRTFEFTWSSDRQGWSLATYGEATVHYFVPPYYLKGKPYREETYLSSLCRRTTVQNIDALWPASPTLPRCKLCQKKLDAITA